MPPSGPDASNNCLPPKSPVIISVPPVPSCIRGERCSLDGKAGRLNTPDKALLAYPSGKLVVVREIDDDDDDKPLDTTGNSRNSSSSKLPVLVYRGHLYKVTALKMAPSGAYMASGDERGILRVWAFDHEDHLCKFDKPALTGPIRDIDWDNESKKLVVGGERAGGDASSDCARCIQWDTGVTVGQLAQHLKGRVATVAFKPNRPFRIVTGGKDDTKTFFHKGPPFTKIPPENGIPADMAHSPGASVTCVRYNAAGTWVVSVSSDRSICLYDGKTLEFKYKMEQVHKATIYAVAWSADDQHILTASGDGTCKLLAVVITGSSSIHLQEKQTWNPAEQQFGKAFTKVPIGGAQVGCTFVQGTRPVSVGLNGQISLLPLAAANGGGSSSSGSGSSSSTIQVLTGHYAPVDCMAVDYTHSVFYTGDTDGIICVWDLKTFQPIRRLEPPEGNNDLMYVVHKGAISGLACTIVGSLLSVGWDDKLYVTNENGKVGMNPVSLPAQPSAIASGTNLAVIATVQGLLLVENGKILGDLITTSYEPQAVCVTKNNETVYVGGKDCKIYIYSVTGGSTLKEKHVIENGHLKPIHALALSNDETKLAAGDERDICVWDVNSSDYAALVGKGKWCFHVQRIKCLGWSPDDKLLVSGGADDSIYVWSLEKKMRRLHYPYAHRGGVTGVNFVKGSGYMFISVGVDAVVNVWDITNDARTKFK